MKTLDLNVCGVSEMSLAQMQEVEGGFFLFNYLLEAMRGHEYPTEA